MLRLIIYVSEYRGDQDTICDDLRAIRDTSKEINLAEGITGVLLYENRHFVQAIEGGEAEIAALVERLRADRRHRDMRILVDIEIASRHFGQWNMDTLNLDDTSLFTSDTLIKLRDAYARNIEISDATFVCLIQDLLNTPGVEAFLNT